MEPARSTLPGTRADERQTPSLRLLQGKGVAPEVSFASLRAWITLFGALAFSGGHGIFLFTALTRLSKVPGSAEIGSPFEIAVVGWFLAAAPLALLAVPLRGRFLRLQSGTAWSLASLALLLSLVAFASYLHAVALG